MRNFKIFIILVAMVNSQFFVAQTNIKAIDFFVEKAKESPCKVEVLWEDIDNAKMQYVEVQSKCIKHIRENPNYTSIYLLRALDELYPNSVQEISKSTRAAVYGSLFTKFRCIDNWVTASFVSGNIVIQEKPLALEMLALQDFILPYLQQNLDDKRPIIFSEQSENSYLPNNIRLEKRDIAYYFIKKIKGEQVALPISPVVRKKNIESFSQKLSVR